MHLDAIDLKDFYASPLGAVVRRLLGARVRARWSNLQGKSLFGVGFATPYLGAFRNDAVPIGALMPAELGVISWFAGVRERAGANGFGRNYVHVGINTGDGWLHFQQAKHHRWSLDANQIAQFGADVPRGARLVPITIQAPGQFRPNEVDPKTDDTRRLGVQVRVGLE